MSVIEFKGQGGDPNAICIPAHDIGVNAAAWAPSTVSGSLVQTQNEKSSSSNNNTEVRRFVTGGCDNKVKIWKYDSTAETYTEEASLEGHSDWVRDVAWSPSVLSKSYIASASQDKTVIIWTQESNGPWQKKLLKSEKFPDVVWRVSWSLSGNVLAVSGGDNKVTLWRENLAGEWESAGVVDE